jgi:hypothetical protein
MLATGECLQKHRKYRLLLSSLNGKPQASWPDFHLRLRLAVKRKRQRHHRINIPPVITFT